MNNKTTIGFEYESGRSATMAHTPFTSVYFKSHRGEKVEGVSICYTLLWIYVSYLPFMSLFAMHLLPTNTGWNLFLLFSCSPRISFPELGILIHPLVEYPAIVS